MFCTVECEYVICYIGFSQLACCDGLVVCGVPVPLTSLVIQLWEGATSLSYVCVTDSNLLH